MDYQMKDNLSYSSKKHNNVLLLIGLMATVFRLGLFMRYPYAAFDSGAYDDVYLLERAASILSGEWLGEYNYVTLIKGASFPLFVAIANLLCMPYSMLLGLFYIAAAVVFCHAMQFLTENKWLILLTYLYLIFSPIGFDAGVTQRLYRNAIIFPSVLLVIGSILLVYYKRKDKISAQLPWLILSGVSFFFFTTFGKIPSGCCRFLSVVCW